MITIKTKDLEKKLGLKIYREAKAVGIDTASRSGWCKIECHDGETTIDYGFVNVKSKDVYFKYDEIIKIFQKLLDSWQCSVVVEDVYFGRSASTLKMLARIGMIVYVLSRLGGWPVRFLLPSTARAGVGFNGTAKKDFVHAQIRDRLGIDFKDVDVIDAFVLALNGVVNKEVGGMDI